MVGAQFQGLRDLSQFLGFAPQRIFVLVKYSNQSYVPISIPKKSNSGLNRQLFIPTSELKGVQRAILRKIIEKFPSSVSARAYVKGISLVRTGDLLSGNTAVLKLDLTSFFPSITDRRVFGLFTSLGFNGSCSHILTKLCTLNGTLPQGSPVSPAISNLVAKSLDGELKNVAHSFGLRYLRYSDDMFFVGDNDFVSSKFVDAVQPIIQRHNFTINSTKTKYFPRGARRVTLGLVTHEESAKLPREFRRKLRAAFFRASRDIEYALENMATLRGNLAWYKSVYGKDTDYIHYNSVLTTAAKVKIHKTYRSV